VPSSTPSWRQTTSKQQPWTRGAVLPACLVEGLALHREGAGQKGMLSAYAAMEALVPGIHQPAAYAAAAISCMRAGVGCLCWLVSCFSSCWWHQPCAGRAWWCGHTVGLGSGNSSLLYSSPQGLVNYTTLDF
jgi:hypothetical protein